MPRRMTPNEDGIDEVDIEDDGDDDLSPLLISTPEHVTDGEETKRTGKRNPSRTTKASRSKVVVRKNGRRRS